MSSQPRYRVTLDGKDGQVAEFPFNELPTPGLQFTVKRARWRVVAVAVAINSTRDAPNLVECDVVLAARWSDETEGWEKVS
ncbi:hypothetical protein GCM10009555_017650 [Acrocarpospora macrocephala]|uniref:Uncharacterized protein n=1 Tax=Acrocarpospora macrocephala TaxID=150177 RepID=A0A5M3WEA9_9ACTN|nr:hypothetical protein [Acrocarpospora macrocephala]GES07425.1 hypothetical protein Amac_010200 [Acrocarpospora macrocephala]